MFRSPQHPMAPPTAPPPRHLNLLRSRRQRPAGPRPPRTSDGCCCLFSFSFSVLSAPVCVVCVCVWTRAVSHFGACERAQNRVDNSLRLPQDRQRGRQSGRQPARRPVSQPAGQPDGHPGPGRARNLLGAGWPAARRRDKARGSGDSLARSELTVCRPLLASRSMLYLHSSKRKA